MEQRQTPDELLLEDEAASAVEQPGKTSAGVVPPADDLTFPASTPAPSRIASMARGVARTLFAFVFSQYVIVTVLVATAALALSKTAADVLTTKFDAITNAIRHF